MSFELNKLSLIAVLALMALSLPLIPVCDCLISDQVIDSTDQSEWDNHSFLSNPMELKIPDLFTKLQLEPLFSLVPISASQVFHPPTVV
jgi:hypothetical protein